MSPGDRAPPDERYTLRFWAALEDGRFLAHGCEACGRTFFPPAPVCPTCGSRAVDWREVDPRGHLYTFTRQHVTPPGFPAPLVVGLTELAAGPRLLAPVGADYDDLRIGAAVELRPTEYEHDYDRGDLSGYPYFEAVPVDGE